MWLSFCWIFISMQAAFSDNAFLSLSASPLGKEVAGNKFTILFEKPYLDKHQVGWSYRVNVFHLTSCQKPCFQHRSFITWFSTDTMQLEVRGMLIFILLFTQSEKSTHSSPSTMATTAFEVLIFSASYSESSDVSSPESLDVSVGWDKLVASRGKLLGSRTLDCSSLLGQTSIYNHKLYYIPIATRISWLEVTIVFIYHKIKSLIYYWLPLILFVLSAAFRHFDFKVKKHYFWSNFI